MTKESEVDFTYEFCNTTEIGQYEITYFNLEGDSSSPKVGFKSTYTGKYPDFSTLFAYIIIILFLVGLFIGYNILQAKTDKKQIYNNVVEKWETTNFYKSYMGVLLIMFLEYKFHILYLLIFFIWNTFNYLILDFNIVSLISFVGLISDILIIGLIFFVISFLGKVQELISELFEDIDTERRGGRDE